MEKMHERFYKKMTSHGSINVPINLRRELGIQNKDPMVVEEENGAIIIRPHYPRCVICGAEDIGWRVKGKGLCNECVGEMEQIEDEQDEEEDGADA